ncbi:hypothetical protein Back11_17490 [Paenibacillus baekrokdamisoli]|uniref:Uncharacterized protein n=1 Tax=Paenibacillus baekrokdamisoli TaxID=1712516 RepID=A0A3G9JAT7_9BACL|nr:hypothetical protein [Paenibacillus baekrokdamisoli]MBB3072101.1 hypothetical protein [Paenibacillus baekrokdamisoli]BBH20404.1 hypothetical protein Back11_17490 [Paenibacillus baekrokdamisoli]
MGKKRLMLLTIFICFLVLVTGCVPGDGTNSSSHPAGFFWGIWHGWLAPLSLIIGLFKQSIRIYEAHNSGWWYDAGFYIAVISGFGGISLSRRRKQHTKEH